MESDIFAARIEDAVKICENCVKPKFLGFLSPEESKFAEKLLKNKRIGYSFFGGYQAAERVFLSCFPLCIENLSFPIEAITFTFRKEDVLRHRDFLGALMSLGIKRESIGDILIEEGRAVVFVSSEIKKYVLTQITKIGRIGVDCKNGFTEPLPKADELLDFSCTVASNRLDCVVSSLINASRNSATEVIESGFVSVNSVVCEKISKPVFDGDIISIRKNGRFIVDSISDHTKKDRLILKYKKYN